MIFDSARSSGGPFEWFLSSGSFRVVPFRLSGVRYTNIDIRYSNYIRWRMGKPMWMKASHSFAAFPEMV